jgi:flavin reductase (DIM6/NTAB) family NADH-FMN oxidoreductase RutF
MAFTVNVPDASLISYVVFAGKYSGRDMNKFDETGLTPVKADYVNAPYVKEFPIVLECKVTEYHDLGSNLLKISLRSCLEKRSDHYRDKIHILVAGRRQVLVVYAGVKASEYVILQFKCKFT